MSICLEYSTLYRLKQDAYIRERKRACQALRGQESTEEEKQDVTILKTIAYLKCALPNKRMVF